MAQGKKKQLAKKYIVFQKTPGALDEILGTEHNSEADTKEWANCWQNFKNIARSKDEHSRLEVMVFQAKKEENGTPLKNWRKEIMEVEKNFDIKT